MNANKAAQAKPPRKQADPKQGSVEKWRFKKTTKRKTVDGEKFVWCPKHGRKNEEGVQSGMYIPEPHDHEAWLAKKTKENEEWKAEQAARKVAPLKCKAEGTPSDSAKGAKLSLAKSVRTALTTRVQMSDNEAQAMVDDIMAGKFLPLEEGEVKE